MKEAFKEWSESPVTEMFLKYLVDSAKEESQIIADSILSGSVVSESEQIRVASECITLMRISEITLEEIEDFYKEK